MAATSATDVRAFIVDSIADELGAIGFDRDDVPDDLDMIARGIVDSFGLLELLAGIEERFGLELDFEDADPERLTVLGELCRLVAEESGPAVETPR